MQLLKERILQDGRCFPGGILKVDNFINHQMDPDLMSSIGKEFKELYKDSGVTKILTIEASGIAPAIMAGAYLHLPVVFAKKKQPKTMENMLVASIHSFTKDRTYTVCLSADYIRATDKVLIIDDFLAFGNAAFGLLELIKQAGAEVAGFGFIIEKSFQNGGEKLRQLGYRVESLAQVENLDDCKIILK